MKQPAIAILFLFISLQLHAQKIHFTDTSNEWKVVYESPDPPHLLSFEYEKFRGDTIINSKVYKKLVGDFSALTFIREDTTVKKVFVLYPLDDTSEQVLYDYNLKIGDTITYNYQMTTKVSIYIVGTDSTVINGIEHKVWHCQIPSSYSYTIIEGIGCLYYFYFPIRNKWEGPPQLSCFSNNATTPVLSPSIYSGHVQFDNTTSCALSTEKLTEIQSRTYIAPNPIIENSKIIFPYEIHSGNLIVYDAIGKIILTTEIRDVKYYALGDKQFSPGLYYYRITDHSNSNIFSGKFIKQ